MRLFSPAYLCQHTFLPLLDERSAVIDLGANEGAFSHGIIERFGCGVVALEAMPHLAAAIKPHPKLDLRQEAIAGANGTIQINRYEKRCASVLGPIENEVPVSVTTVNAVSLDELMSRVGSVDLLKSDIEGAELAMFDAAADATLLACKQITVEFHDFVYPETREHVERIKQRLGSLGFHVVPFSLDNTDVLFINPAAGVSSLEVLWLRTVVKYGRGIVRRLKRAIG